MRGGYQRGATEACTVIPPGNNDVADRIPYIHLDDALNGKDHLPIGQGELNPDLYAEMLEPGKTRVATMEVGRGADAQLVSREALRARFGGVIG